MIDLHSHILPSTDDGARDLGVSLAMARKAAEDGVNVMAATPHFQNGLYAYSGKEVRDRIASLQSAIDAEGISLRIISGGDNRIEPDLVFKIKSDHALTLHDTDYILVEPPHDVFPASLDSCFADLLSAGYRPILTHPERMQWFTHRFDALVRLFQNGVHMQVTAGALLGEFGRGAVLASRRLFDRGMVSIVASDAHDERVRVPGLSKAHGWVKTRYGEGVADRIFIDHPEMIMRNQSFEPGIPIDHADLRSFPSRQNFMSKIKSFVLGRE